MTGNNIYVQGSYIDIHDNEVVNLNVDKGEVHVACGTAAESNADQASSADANPVPKVLSTPEAEALWEKLIAAGLMTADWQKPPKVSWSEAGMIAMHMAMRLDITNLWQTFGQLWHQKPENLRTYYNRALNQQKTLNFQERLKQVLG